MIPVGETSRKTKAPLVTWTLIALNTIIFFYFYLQGAKVFTLSIYKFGLIPFLILQGKKLYTLLTSMFMHGSLEHLLGNMLFLYVFGPAVENRLGRLRFISLYLLSGFFADFFHIFIEAVFQEPLVLYGPFGHTVIDPLKIPSVGASGAISGVLGAYLVLMPNAFLDVLTTIGLFPIVIRIPAVVFILFWFLYQLYMGVLSLALPYPFFSGVAFWAHVGGWVAGFIIAIVIGRKARRTRRVRIDYEGRVWYEIPVE